jgi:transketolase
MKGQWKKIDELCIKTIMMLSVDAVEQAQSGHPGMPMGDAAMAYVLWERFLRHNPKNPAWPNRDRFVLSAGHGSMLLYSLLHLTGHDISLSDLKNFRQWESKTPGHPEYCLPCGIETTTGPLGQGFATGVGMAIAQKYLASMFNRPGFPLLDYDIYAICSDGDLMEGVASEAASLAGHLRLGNIAYLYSDNKISIEGPTDLAFTDDVAKRFQSYGWHTQKVDGYDLASIGEAIRKARAEKERPSLILARTHIGYCSPNQQDCASVHGAPLGVDEVQILRRAVGWPNRSFLVPKEALAQMRKAVKRGKDLEDKWKALFKRYKQKHPDLADTWERLAEGRLPRGWDKGLPSFKPEDGAVATRSASGKFLNAVATRLPELLGGSADLAPSNNTFLKDFPEFAPGVPGRNLHFGVREHAMGAALNGMALSGMLIPYGGTFLIFSDYMRASQRLAALMGKRVVYVLTHDSVGLGEDGPTHQPVEQLAALRAMPNMLTMRPADANETVEAWKLALKNTGGPTALILSRQKLPIIDRSRHPGAGGVRRGGYVISDSKERPDVILLASGSEVHLCLEAAEALTDEGYRVRVVNMASFELFDRQTKRYRDSVLPPDIGTRLAVEAAATLPWYKYVGLEGEVLGIDRFGASAPAKVIFKKLGFTAANVAKRARALVRSRKGA